MQRSGMTETGVKLRAKALYCKRCPIGPFSLCSLCPLWLKRFNRKGRKERKEKTGYAGLSGEHKPLKNRDKNNFRWLKKHRLSL